ITLLENEKEELKKENHELLKELETLAEENMRLKSGIQGEVQKVEEVDVFGLIKEYLEIKEKKRKVTTEGELLELDKRQKKVQESINAFLEEKSIDKLLFWRTLNLKGIDEVRKMLRGE
ncbi:hypothetical protein, partial [Thermococcus sp. Bubb.Bath]